jgi:hypothetical protein
VWYVGGFNSVCESLLCEEFLEGEDLEYSTAENDEGLDDGEENNAIINADVGLC